MPPQGGSWFWGTWRPSRSIIVRRPTPAQDLEPDRQVVLAAPERPVVPPIVRERRAAWGARLLPSLHQFVKAEAVTMSGEAGHHVSMEDVVEALIREMQVDADLRAQVFQRAARA